MTFTLSLLPVLPAPPVRPHSAAVGRLEPQSSPISARGAQKHVREDHFSLHFTQLIHFPSSSLHHFYHTVVSYLFTTWLSTTLSFSVATTAVPRYVACPSLECLANGIGCRGGYQGMLLWRSRRESDDADVSQVLKTIEKHSSKAGKFHLKEHLLGGVDSSPHSPATVVY